MADAPYRASPSAETAPPREHVYDPKVVGRLAPGLLPLLILTAAGAIVGGAYDVAPIGFLGGLVVGVIVMLRIRKGSQPVRFRVEKGRLIVDRGASTVIADVLLEDLLDVSMTTDTYDPRDNIRGQVVGFGVQAPKQHPSNESRIAIQVRGKGSIFLSDQNTKHLEAEEQLGKIRAFLRKSEWIPIDERPPPSSEMPASSEI